MSEAQKPSDTPDEIKDTSPSKKLSDAGKKSIPADSSKAIHREESKASQFFRSFLRWTGIALIVFGLGALASYFLFSVPKSNQLKLADQNLATANAKITELEGKISALELQVDELSALKDKNQILESDLESAQLHVLLLNVLVDIRTAQYALADGNSAAAGEVLGSTEDTLAELQQALEDDQAESVDSFISRLNLAMSGLDTNTFAARSDLEVLANSLIQLEGQLFSEP